jgi:uncharacterized protein (DUF58 family)
MSEKGSLIPAPVEARAQPFKRLGFAFGKRFFLLLVIGLGWIGPAFVEQRFIYAMIGWDALVLTAWALDLARLPRPSTFALRRSWQAPPALSVEAPIELAFVNDSKATVRAALFDEVPPYLTALPPQLTITAAGRRESSVTYTVRPMRRGEAKIGNVYIRYQSALGLAERWAMAPLRQQARVYPNLDEARRHSIYLTHSRQIEMEKRHSRMRGLGREFESLREYRDGDELRDISWTATARRGKLVTRLYQIERSQTIWIVIDTGRLMRARISGLSKLDYAVNAALSLAQIALYSGDRVGLVAYGRRIEHRVAAARGSAHLRVLIDELASISEEASEADHLGAAGRLLGDQKRRSLVVWLTDLAETAMTPEVIEAASLMMPRHLVLFAVIGQPDLHAMAAVEPRSVEQMYQAAAAQEVVHRRERLLARLREQGALALEVNSSALSLTLVNSYLDVKERNRL